MYMRLAFAVAAHLDPEILVVDEVLAVGDAAFRQKSLGKMGEVAKAGRTVFLVSHNMSAISSLCTRCMLMEKGRLLMDGPTHDVVAEYQHSSLKKNLLCVDLSEARRKGSGRAKFESAEIIPFDHEGNRIGLPYTGCKLTLKVTLRSNSNIVSSNPSVILFDANGCRIVDANLQIIGESLNMRAGERVSVSFTINELLLKEGLYTLGVWVGAGGEGIDHVEPAASFEVLPEPINPKFVNACYGSYACKFDAEIIRNDHATLDFQSQ